MGYQLWRSKRCYKNLNESHALLVRIGFFVLLYCLPLLIVAIVMS